MDPWITLNRRELMAERVDEATDNVEFSQRLAEQVIANFTSPGELVLDPFAGFGTTAVVATRMGRRTIAVELLPERAEIIRRRVGANANVVTGDALDLRSLVFESVDLCLTSPPYMTRQGHSENPMTGYRTLDGSYERYLDDIESVGLAIASLLRVGGHLVVNAATTVGVEGLTPLADDIACRLEPHLARRPDLPIAWDEPPFGIVDDRCLVYEKVA